MGWKGFQLSSPCLIAVSRKTAAPARTPPSIAIGRMTESQTIDFRTFRILYTDHLTRFDERLVEFLLDPFTVLLALVCDADSKSDPPDVDPFGL